METSTSAMDMNIVVKVYAVIENGTVKLYTYTEAPGEMADGWRKEGERDFEIDSISELFSNYANIDTAPFDMLERTNSGYKLSADKYAIWLSQRPSTSGIAIEDVKGGLDFIISEGRLQKIVDNVSCIEDLGYMKLNMKRKQTMVYKNYGTTTITFPDDLKEYLGK